MLNTSCVLFQCHLFVKFWMYHSFYPSKHLFSCYGSFVMVLLEQPGTFWFQVNLICFSYFFGQFLLVDLRCHGDSASIKKRGPHTVASTALDVLKLVSIFWVLAMFIMKDTFFPYFKSSKTESDMSSLLALQFIAVALITTVQAVGRISFTFGCYGASKLYST